MNRSKEIPGYLYALDGLRAVSMLLIWLFHSFQQSWIFATYPQFSALQDRAPYNFVQSPIFFAVCAIVLAALCYFLVRSIFGNQNQILTVSASVVGFGFFLWRFYLWWKSVTPGKPIIDLTTLQEHGYIAIDAFFVLSGFCLFYPIARSMFGECKMQSWKTFYYKRIKKIWPSYLLLLLLMILVPALSYGTKDLHGWEFWKHFLYHAFFIHNISPETIGTTISTAWTLAIEVQFYLIFPLIAFLMRKSPFLTLLGGSILSELLRLHYTVKGENSAFMQGYTLLYIDIFLWGMLAAYLVVWARNKLPEMKNNWVQIGMTVVSIASLGIAYQFMKWMGAASFGSIQGAGAATMLRMMYRPILGFAFAAFLFATSNSVKAWEKGVWGNRVFIFLSTISYNFYLWHQNIHIFFKEVTPKGIPEGMADVSQVTDAVRWKYLLLTLVWSLLIATIVTYLVEIPFAKYGFAGYFRHWKDVITGTNSLNQKGKQHSQSKNVRQSSAQQTKQQPKKKK